MTITFEMEELVFYKTRKNFTGFCNLCGASIEMLTTETAALFLGFSELQIFRLIETGSVHYVEAERVFICRNSLEDWADILKNRLVKSDSFPEKAICKKAI